MWSTLACRRILAPASPALLGSTLVGAAAFGATPVPAAEGSGAAQLLDPAYMAANICAPIPARRTAFDDLADQTAGHNGRQRGGAQTQFEQHCRAPRGESGGCAWHCVAVDPVEA